MNLDTKIRIAVMLVLAAVPLVAAVLAAHGILISPLDDLGPGPH